MKIAPSVLSADFARLGEEVNDIKLSGADYAHYDVMDGRFVPNLSMGIPVLKSLRKATDMIIDVHLMIVEPVRYVKAFCDSGADIVNVHVEADTEENTHKAIELIHSCGKKAGITLKPGTPAQAVLPFIKDVELILVMTVNPGFGGQSFMHSQMGVLAQVRKYVDELNPGCEVEVDGGIDANTAPVAARNGADVLVAGSAVFGKPDRAAAIAAIRNSI